MVKVYIDAGHGGTDVGANANGLYEKDVTLKIAKKVEQYLKDYKGVKIKMSRSGDSYPTLTQRTNEANSWGADLFLSIHINSGGGTGYEDYIYNSLSNSSKTGKIRNDIHNEVMKKIDMRDRGKKKANFHVLRESRMSAVLTENGFIDHSSDSKKMKSQSWINDIARGHVNGIAKAFNLKKKSGGGSSSNTGGGSSSNKYLEILASSLWTYNSPDWNDKAEIVNKGEVFTVKKDKFKVGNGHMYQIKSGLYITANTQYVKPYTKGGSGGGSKNFKVGDRVTVKKSAKRFATGESIADFVKGNSYKIIQVKSDRVLLDGIMSWVKKSDVK